MRTIEMLLLQGSVTCISVRYNYVFLQSIRTVRQQMKIWRKKFRGAQLLQSRESENPLIVNRTWKASVTMVKLQATIAAYDLRSTQRLKLIILISFSNKKY